MAAAANPIAPTPVTGTGGQQAYLPPRGDIYQGSTAPVAAYQQAVGKHPVVYQESVAWGQYLPGITSGAIQAKARLMMSITTMYGSRNVVTPQDIADGKGDTWLIALGAELAQSGVVTYIRLMPEMDNASAPYCAFNASGSPRSGAYSSTEFKQAWRRATMILRGGSVAGIDRALRRLGLPPLRTGSKSLATPPVAMVWTPLTAGTPDVAGNQPSNYFPGNAYVDWVSTDFYSDYPDFKRLTPFAAQYSRFPFVFGEYAIWEGDNQTTFIPQLFSWIASHKQVRMLIYVDDSPLFALSKYPSAARAIRHAIAGPAYPQYAPEWQR